MIKQADLFLLSLRIPANQLNADADIIVPVSLVRTYDIPVDQAEELQIFAHDADVPDVTFLYHMQ